MVFGFLASDYNRHCHFLNDLSIFGKNRSSETKIPARQTGIRCFLLIIAHQISSPTLRHCSALPKGSGFSKLSAVKALFGRSEACNTCFQVFRRPIYLYRLAGSSEKAFCFDAAVHSPITSVLYHVCALRSATCCSASVYELFRPILLKRTASLPYKHAILPFLLFPFSDDL